MQKRPLSITDRGRKIRGTTSNLALLHRKCPHGVQQRLSLSRANPSFPTVLFRKATPGGISARFPTALHHPAALWRERERLLLPIHVFYETETMLTKNFPFVKGFLSDTCEICPNPKRSSRCRSIPHRQIISEGTPSLYFNNPTGIAKLGKMPHSCTLQSRILRI